MTINATVLHLVSYENIAFSALKKGISLAFSVFSHCAYISKYGNVIKLSTEPHALTHKMIWREHSKHALLSSEDQPPSPLKYQNISTRIA